MFFVLIFPNSNDYHCTLFIGKTTSWQFFVSFRLCCQYFCVFSIFPGASKTKIVMVRLVTENDIIYIRWTHDNKDKNGIFCRNDWRRNGTMTEPKQQNRQQSSLCRHTIAKQNVMHFLLDTCDEKKKKK